MSADRADRDGPPAHADHAADQVARSAQVDGPGYWRTNVRLVRILLAVWFLSSFGAGIFFAPALDAYHLPGTGFPLGFWFAQQGAILIFIAIIWIYAWLMNRLERKLGIDEK